jgi:predicted dehydrogenase
MLELQGDIFASIDPSWSRPESYPNHGNVTMEIIAENGVINIDVFSQTIDLYDSEPYRHYQENWGFNSDFALVKSAVDMIRYKREPLISGYDGVKAVETALAAYRSAKEKKQIVLINDSF